MFGLVVCDETSSLKSFRFSDPRLAYWLNWGEQDTLSTVTNPPTSGTATTTLAWPETATTNKRQPRACVLCQRAEKWRRGRGGETTSTLELTTATAIKGTMTSKFEGHDEDTWKIWLTCTALENDRPRIDGRTNKRTCTGSKYLFVCVCGAAREYAPLHHMQSSLVLTR